MDKIDVFLTGDVQGFIIGFTGLDIGDGRFLSEVGSKLLFLEKIEVFDRFPKCFKLIFIKNILT